MRCSLILWLIPSFLFATTAFSQCVILEDQKAHAADALPGTHFGSSLAADGSVAIIGAPTENTNQGSAYVFVQQGLSWVESQKLLASNGGQSDFLATPSPSAAM